MDTQTHAQRDRTNSITSIAVAGGNYIKCYFIVFLTGVCGSGVGSFFAFSRYLILMNIFLCILWFSFVIIPTAVQYNYSGLGTHNIYIHNILDGQVLNNNSHITCFISVLFIYMSYY